MPPAVRSFVRPFAAAAAVAGALCGARVEAFVLGGATANASRWQTTASGPTGSVGDPATLTWSIVPDGTLVLDPINATFEPSDLVATFDATFGAGPGGSDYTQRPWFALIEQAFERWDELSGVSYVYEPNDDGVIHGETEAGVLGVRGDVRVGGTSIDGPETVLGYNYFSFDGGDLGLDTDDTAYYSQPSNNFAQLRYTVAHEAGHGLGLDHTSSTDADFLMEANPNSSIDGPQHDDLRGIHWLYGDALEKTNGGLGNGTAATAHGLGALSPAAPLAIGASGDGVLVDPTETDFVSVANASDDDYFSFTVSEPATLQATLTPRGAQYNQSGAAFDTTDDSDLSLTLYASDGVTPIASAAAQPAGAVEEVSGVALAPGEYFAAVRGAGTLVQFYQLDLAAEAILPGDYNRDGRVDAGDYAVFRDTLGSGTAPYSGADGDGDGEIGPGDYALWAAQFGEASGPGSTAIPEPTAAALAFLALASCAINRRF